MGKVVDLEAGKQRRTAAAKGKRRPRRSKTALVLGGGGFTGGVYEIGALRALDLLSVNRTVNQFDVYVGTSAGAFVASMAANGSSMMSSTGVSARCGRRGRRAEGRTSLSRTTITFFATRAAGRASHEGATVPWRR